MTAPARRRFAVSSKNQPHGRFELLSTFELRYHRGQARISTGDARVGSHLTSGTGTARWPVLTGHVLWDLFEAQADTLCAANFRGRVETEDGALVDFDCLGFLRRGVEDHIWTMSGGVVFESKETVLLPLPALWHGEFDARSYVHRYIVYLPR